MKRPHSGRSSLPVVAFLLSSAVASAQVVPQQPAPVPVYDPIFQPDALSSGPGIAPAHPVGADMYRLWNGLPGTHEATLASGTLTISLRKISTFLFFVEIAGTADGEDLFQRGRLELSAMTDGRIFLDYRPETLGSRYGCRLMGRRTRSGYRFETEFGGCSLPFHRPLSKWTVATSAREIRVTEEGSEAVTRLVRQASR